MSSTKKPVLIIGDACVDLLVQVPERSGNHQHQTPPELHGGGTGANTAVALARLGTSTAFIGTIGDDGYGRFTREALESEGVDTSHVITSDAFTSLVLALIDPHGERTLFGWPRRGAAHTQLLPEHIEPQIIQQMTWVHTTGMCMVQSPVREAALRGMELAREAKVPVSFDLNIRLGFDQDGKLPETFLNTLRRAISLSDYVFGSGEEEFVHLTPEDSFEAAAQTLAEDKRTVIVRLGSEGAMAVAPEQENITVPAFPVEMVDTLGAGDAFNAGFITAYLEGQPLAEAVRWGNAVAALQISQPGARSSPHRKEVEAMMKIGN